MSKNIDKILQIALEEDLGIDGDITSNLTIDQNQDINFQISNRKQIILCGVDIALEVFKKIDKEHKLKLKKHHNDGEFLSKGSKIISGSGDPRLIFAAERVALNIIQHLSGISTNTSNYVAQLSGKTKILDTRKTIPTLRELQKYAVKIGGGKNHRMALYDGFLIKDNHIAACGSISKAVSKIRDAQKKGKYTDLKIEVECDNVDQVKECLLSKVDIILLDNMSQSQMREAVNIIKDQAKIEVSGNVKLTNIKDICLLGVDYISIGALTHSVKSVDIGLDIL